MSVHEGLLTDAEAELRHNASSSEISVSLGSDRFEGSDDGGVDAHVAGGGTSLKGGRSGKAATDAGSRGARQPYTPQGYTPRGRLPRTPGARSEKAARWPARASETWSDAGSAASDAPLGLHEVERQRRTAAEAQRERAHTADRSPFTTASPPRSQFGVQMPGVYMGEPRKPFVDTGDRQMIFFSAAYAMAAQQQLMPSLQSVNAQSAATNNIVVLPFMPTNSSFRMGSSMMGMGSEGSCFVESQSAPLRMTRGPPASVSRDG